MKKHIVWKWKASIQDYVGKEGIYGVRVALPFLVPPDPSIFGRDGWVGYIEEVKDEREDIAGREGITGSHKLEADIR